MLTVSYILSQLFAIIYYILFAITYYMKNKKTILVLGVISIFIHSISYALLGGWTAVAMGLVAVLRNLIFISEEKKDKKKRHFTQSVNFEYFVDKLNMVLDLILLLYY